MNVTPTYVVVDGMDGMVFWRGADGVLFDADTAADFAASRNADLREPGTRFWVASLTKVAA